MISMLFGFLAGIKTTLIRFTNWCSITLSNVITNNLLGVQSPI